MKFYFIKKLNFRQKTALSIYLFAFAPIFLFGTLYLINVINSEKIQIIQTNTNQLQNCIDNVNEILINESYKINYVCNHSEIIKSLSVNYNDDYVDMLEANNRVKEILNNIQANTNSQNIYIYTTNSTLYTSNNLFGMDKLNEEVKNQIFNTPENKLTWNISKHLNEYEKEEYFLSIYKKILSIDEVLGICEIRIPFPNIGRNFQIDFPKESLIIYKFNEQNLIILKMESQGNNTFVDVYNINKSSQYVIIEKEIKYNNHLVQLYIPKSHFNLMTRKPLVLTVLAMSFFVIFILLLIKFIIKNLTSKVTELIDKKNSIIESWKKPIDINYDSNDISAKDTKDEFEQIALKFEEHSQIIKIFYKQIADYEVEIKKLEIELLQERINPHFLYNTLSTIKWTYADSELSNIIDSLVRYYRIVLNKGNHILTIKQELELLNEYVNIQKFAYNSNFEFLIDVDNEILNCYILKQLLQPIIENAILHGLNNLEYKGELKMTLKVDLDDIVITISDNGKGISRKMIEQIKTGQVKKKYSGYGIRNIQQRIKMYYGEQYGLIIDNKLDLGTNVSITIPKIKQ